MLKEPRNILFKKALILGGLLLCLCFSKGEGVHLLPFFDSPSHLQTSVLELKNTSLNYQLSTHHQNGIDGKFQLKLLKVGVKDLHTSGNLIFKNYVLKADCRLNENFVSKPKIPASKFLLTASSDCSPPFAVSS